MKTYLIKSLVLTLFCIACCSNKSRLQTANKNIATNSQPTSSFVLTNENPIIKDTISLKNKQNRHNEITTQTNTVDHSLWNELLKKHVAKNGSVHYKGFIADKKIFNQYLKILANNPPQEKWSKEAKLAFWMNAYNAFTIKLITENYPLESIKDIRNPWDKKFIKIGTKSYDLNEIEHDILRKMNEPRIHFGINCASVSCPPLANKAFTKSNVNESLDQLAKRFINDANFNVITQNQVSLSKIFKWFSKDFKTEGSLIDYLNNYSAIRIENNAKISYKDYNWDLNE